MESSPPETRTRATPPGSLADTCLRQAMRTLRVPPFDGPPAKVIVPYTLR